MSLKNSIVLLAVVLLFASCAQNKRHSSYASAPQHSAVELPAIEKSLFSRDKNGQLTEENLQRLLAAPLESEFPARLGILPVVTSMDWRGPNPNYEHLSAAVSKVAQELGGSELFPMVTEMLPIPSGAEGMEALREVAARYRLRYILLYREAIAESSRANGWASTYATGVGALFMPGQVLTVDGVVEATMLDVKTGTLLFTVRQRVAASRRSNVWQNSRKLATMRRKATLKAAGRLTAAFRVNTDRYAKAAKETSDNKSGFVGSSNADKIEQPSAAPIE